MPRVTKITVREGTTAQWVAADAASGADPTRLLAAGEPGRDTTLNLLKFGDGVSTWAALPPAQKGTFASPGHVDLRDFGTLGDGSVINAAIVQAQTAKLPVFIPSYAGRVWETGSTIVLKHGVSLISGSAGTFEESPQFDTPGPIIKLAAGANVDLLVNDPAAPIRPGQDNLHRWQRSRIAGITFDGNRAGQTVNTVDALHFTKAWAIDLDFVTVLDGARYGINLDDCNEIHGHRVTAIGAHKSPVRFFETADCEWTAVQIGGGFESALVLDGSLGNNLSGMFYNAGFASRPTLTTALSAGGSEVEVFASLSAAAFLPKSGTIVVDSEQISYSAFEVGKFTGCVRAVNGTVKAAHSIGAQIRLAPAHANNVHIINTSKMNVIRGRFDQAHQRAIYLEALSDSNTIDGAAFLWGLYNLTGQAAVYCDSNYNRLNLALSRNGETNTANANQTIGLERGVNAYRNIENIAFDAGIPTYATGGFSGNQVSTSNFGNSVSPSDHQIGGRFILTNLLTGHCALPDQTEDPPAVAGHELLYARSGGIRYRAPSGVFHDLGQDGRLAGIITPTGNTWTATAFALLAGRGYFHRFEVKKTLVGTLVAFAVTTAASLDDSVEVAVYDSTGTRLDTSGLVTGKLNSLGMKTVTLAETLLPGTYYASLLCPTIGGTAASVLGSGLVSIYALQLFGSTAPNMLGCQMAGLATLPTTIVPTFATSNTPTLAFRSA